MTQEEEQLLLKGICENFPYGLWVKETLYSDSTTIYPPDKYPTEKSKACKVMSVHGNCVTLHVSPLGWKPEVMELRHIKPYLRPMSSMTEEEKEYIKNRWCYEDWGDIYNFLNHYQIDAGDAYSFTDWLNEHHFDYRGLIEKGLALEAPVDMYRND